MTAAIDAPIIQILTEHGPMSTPDMMPYIYPDTPIWLHTDRVRYIYARCARLRRHGLVDKKLVNRKAVWSIREGEE